MYRTDTRIDSVTRSQSSCSSLVCQLKECQFCLATKAYGSVRSITLRGYERDKSS
jgi:hypothetical protein